MGQRPTPLVLSFRFLSIFPFSFLCVCIVCLAPRREGEGMDAAGRPSPVARMALQVQGGRSRARGGCQASSRRPPRGTLLLPHRGADRGEASDVWMPGRPPAHASQLPSGAFSSLRASWSETGARHAFLAFPLASYYYYYVFLFSWGERPWLPRLPGSRPSNTSKLFTMFGKISRNEAKLELES